MPTTHGRRCIAKLVNPAISEGHGDAALALLKAGAETDKQNTDGMLAIDMAPDAKVSGHVGLEL